MKIPDEVVDVMAAYLPHSMDCEWQPGGDCPCWNPRQSTIRAALEAVSPVIEAQALEAAVEAFPLETITAPDTAVVWLHRRAQQIRKGPRMSIPEDSMGPNMVLEHLRGQDNATTVKAMMLKLQRPTPVAIAAQVIKSLESDAWEAGMRHALTWLGLKQYADVMAKDNPHGKVEG